jgi:hypothetical protein
MKQQLIQLGKRTREQELVEHPLKKSKQLPKSNASLLVAQHAASGGAGRNSTSTLLPPPPGWPLNPSPPTFDVKSTFSGLEGQVIRKEPGLDLLFFKRFLKSPERASLFKYLIEELPWYRVRRFTTSYSHLTN